MAGKTKSKSAAQSSKDSESIGGIGVLDILRVLGGLLVVSTGLSWMVTGDSFTWGYSPWWLDISQIKSAASGPLTLTDVELAAYDGNNPDRPIYLALNGTIYDVSAGRTVYGPGGSYHKLVGKDATRAFVTGCFDTDLHPDLRGVEDMFVPISPAEAEAEGRTVEQKYWDALEGAKELSKGEKKIRRDQERRAAKKQIAATIENWAVMFRGDKGKNYFKVGEVKRPVGWQDVLPKRELCADAKSRRPIRMGP